MSKKLGLNPWVAILTKPKETIKVITGYNPNYRLFFLSFIYGFSAILSMAQNWRLGDRLNLFSIIIPSIVMAPLLGYIFFSIGSWFVFHIGKWLGGKANFLAVRASMAWSNVPSLVNILMWIFLIFLFKNALFQSVEDKSFLGIANLTIVFLVLLVQLIAAIWSLVIYINALSSVQEFSIIKSIFNIILGAVAMAILLFLIMAVFRWTCAPFFDEPTLVNFF